MEGSILSFKKGYIKYLIHVRHFTKQWESDGEE